jgi:hypothetical protein
MKMGTNDTVVGNLLKIKNSLPDHVTLIAVSKNHPVDVIKEILPYHNILGENRVQEMMAKKDFLPGARWHMIGHLQTNKVKYIVPFIEMIHSVDSIKLLKEIEKQAAKHQRKIPVLCFFINLKIAGFLLHPIFLEHTTEWNYYSGPMLELSNF